MLNSKLEIRLVVCLAADGASLWFFDLLGHNTHGEGHNRQTRSVPQIKANYNKLTELFRRPKLATVNFAFTSASNDNNT